MERVDGAICKLIEIASLPVWLVAWIWRNRTIRNILGTLTIVTLIVGLAFGWEIVFTIYSFVGRLGFAAVFMIAQFAFLFMFLSSTKNIETIPGDKGLVNFEDDYYGSEHLVETVQQWVELLSGGQEALEAMGAESIAGICLEGPPGTGKTLLARCLATASQAAFIGTSGSDYQAMFIGVGPMKVMRMYSNARKRAKIYGACIVFVDEADAIGGNRGGVSGDPRRSPVAGGMAGGMFGGGGLGVLSRWLTELDGVRETPLRDQIQNRMRGVFGLPEIKQGLLLTMIATNRIESMDPALLRPGRIDKTIHVDPPDKRSRQLIIEGYLKKVKHDNTVDVDRLVADTMGVTPAQLASAIQRGAPRFALFEGRDHISHSDIDRAIEEDRVGLANPITDFDPEQRHQVAVHEAGHAILTWLVRPKKRITTVSIVRRSGGILGYMRDVDQTEIYAFPLSKLSANVMVLLAGHAAVELVMGEPWSGARGDLGQMQNMLYVMAEHGQFGGFPFKVEDPFATDYIKTNADKYIDDTYAEVTKMLEKHRDKLDLIIDALMEKDTLNSEEIYELLGEPDESDR